MWTPGVGKLGADLYMASCGICHEAEHRATMVPDLKVPRGPRDLAFWQQYIAEGKPGTLMPAFAAAHGGPLTQEQMDTLSVYLYQFFPRNPSAAAILPPLPTVALPGTSHVYRLDLDLDLVQIVDDERVGGITYAVTTRSLDTDTDGGGIKEMTDPDNDDGLPDAWELTCGLNPLNPNDLGFDDNGDRKTNLQGCPADTNPTDPLRRFCLQPVSFEAGTSHSRFPAEADHSHTLECAPFRPVLLLLAPWTAIYDVPAEPVAYTVELTAPSNGQSRSFLECALRKSETWLG